MKGAFTCPQCNEDNACDCETCKPHIKEGDLVNKWTDDHNHHICDNCGHIYTPEAGLDAQWKKYITNPEP